MLDEIDLSQSLPKESFKKELPELRRRLADLTKAAFDRKISSIVVFEGWECAGKGSSIQLLTERLDARGFKVHAIGEPTIEERHRPWLYRFWLRIPRRGVLAIFDRSWYGRVLKDRLEDRVDKADALRTYREVREFEQALVEDGTVLVKIWMHISRKEQADRIKRYSKDPLRRYLITEDDWNENARYGAYQKAIDKMIAETSTDFAPWTVVEANDKHFAHRKVYMTLIDAYDRALLGRGRTA